MKFGKYKKILFFIPFLFLSSFLLAEDKIESVPLINLENLSPTFEEDKDALEKSEEKNIVLKKNNIDSNQSNSPEDNEVYVNLKALDKITAKTSSIKLAVGDKNFFGPLEIKALKCQFTEDSSDTVAYIQVKDLSEKDNNRIFLFNGWTFVSSPTLQSIDHPVYDLWVTSCENI